MDKFVWDQALVEKYNDSGPRYISYPMALEFDQAFTHQESIAATDVYPARALSLHIHILFCHKIITRCQKKADIYLRNKAGQQQFYRVI
jgi:oxygen-independent coproporphyrinogen-3 oxidase